MNPFTETIRLAGLSEKCSRERAWVYAVLRAAAVNAEPYEGNNPVRECYRRLSSIGEKQLLWVRQVLNSTDDKIARGELASA